MDRGCGAGADLLNGRANRPATLFADVAAIAARRYAISRTMVLLGRIELPTSALPRMRSTTELQQPTIRIARSGKAGPGRGALLAVPPCFVKREPVSAGKLPMRKDDNLSREERLAAKLRENLRRRKDQARAISGGNPPLPKDPDPR